MMAALTGWSGGPRLSHARRQRIHRYSSAMPVQRTVWRLPEALRPLQGGGMIGKVMLEI
jgi:hypothetical protein